MKESLGGKHAGGSYLWRADGDTPLQKYNYIAPVAHPTADGVYFNLGAIISSKELYQPLESADDISQGTKDKLIAVVEHQLHDFRNKGLILVISGLLLNLNTSLPCR